MITSKNIGIIAAVLLLAVVITACTTTGTTPGQTTTGANNPSVNTPPAGTATGTSSKVLLTDEPYANNAYLISGDTLDDTAKNAMSGFSMSKTQNSDGTTTIALSSTNPEYQNQSYTLQPGQKLYFIEMSGGDDSNNQEGALSDDKAVIVDADGYVAS